MRTTVRRHPVPPRPGTRSAKCAGRRAGPSGHAEARPGPCANARASRADFLRRPAVPIGEVVSGRPLNACQRTRKKKPATWRERAGPILKDGTLHPCSPIVKVPPATPSCWTSAGARVIRVPMSRMDPRNETTERTREMVTLMPAGAPASTGERISAFPDDLFEQARGRLRLLAVFFFWAFLFDVVLVAALALLKGVMPPVHVLLLPEVSLIGSLYSAVVWWAAKSPRISATRIHTAGLVYEVVICAIAAGSTFYTYYRDTGLIPNLTWVPAIVIMFPLVMPGPPRRMLFAAIAAGATCPLSLAILGLTGKIDTKGGNGYAPAVISCTFAVLFAYMGARVIYRLGREVAIARALGSLSLIHISEPTRL